MMTLICMILIYGASVFSPGPAIEETISFEIHKGGKPVGELTATKEVYDDRVVYKSFSETTISFIFTIRVWYEYHVEYRKGKLYQANVKILVNDDLHKQTRIKLENGVYVFTEIKKRREEVKHIDFPVDYSSVLFLFEEPEEFNASFSEEEGVYHKLEPLGNHTYEKTNSRGRVNKYVYQDGRLDKVFMDAGFFKFQILKKDA